MAKQQQQRTKVIRSRSWGLVLYPDSQAYNYQDRIDLIEGLGIPYAYCTHDKDVYTAEDKIDHPEVEVGSPKKTHTHVIFKFANARTLDQVRKFLALDDADYIQKIDRFDDSLQYLSHSTPDSSSKYQYDPATDIHTNIPNYLDKFKKPSEVDCVRNIFDDIDNTVQNGDFVQFGALFRKCLTDASHWSALRRNYSIIKDYINEVQAGTQARYDQGFLDLADKEIDGYRRREDMMIAWQKHLELQISDLKERLEKYE